ncbi:MAG TPA: type I DNA topoisomerase [Kiritimatiellia bacterium]|nr:type I DNA topoisomerase [Kiritimatiellia bacterium]HMO98230.1 type I DNA topoisomerase [Kiritimatiellia bacterium]HMP97193.1 type I DNA topoisomerase [Kiritimatiellia bacterium]
MAKNLVIVESPAKAKTINKILGRDYVVKASMGHVRDLPEKEIGVDLEKGFKPKYVAIKSREKVVKDLKEAARAAETIVLAPDPDREGEAIAWHLMAALKGAVPPEQFQRVTYNEITAPAIREAFAHPRRINQHKVDAQQARRVLDRIVGYKVSPLLWRRIRGASSAGRVQSAALRLVCDREKEILAFIPEAYWLIGARVRKLVSPVEPFAVKLAKIDGEKADISSADDAARIRRELEGRRMRVAALSQREISKRPQPAYITSTLQQAGNRFFGFPPTRTMRIAQKLYEGVDVGQGVVGLITYMRTDSVNISPVAQQACREFIGSQFGADYLPERPPVYKSKSGAQEAHEAIRPTDVTLTPEKIAGFLDPEAQKLYRIIWQRFVASQMAPARIAQRTAEFDAIDGAPGGRAYLFRASASEVVFPGYMKVTGLEKERKNDAEDVNGEEEDIALPPLVEGEMLEHLEWLEERKETTPPPRYTESSLVKALEDNGVGRPSTYAQTVSTIVDRDYVEKDKRTLKPTTKGMQVNDFLAQHLPELFDIGFTAAMEKQLDEIDEGQVVWTDMLTQFYGNFLGWVEKAKAPPADLKVVTGLLDLLRGVSTWAPETKRGKKTYSDEKFVQSVREQLEKGDPPLTDRQQEALVKMAMRYKDQLPTLETIFHELGLADELIRHHEKSLPPRPETFIKLEMLKGVAYNPPRQVGKRTYDDKEFVASLESQVTGGKRLSENQVKYLDRLVLKYADQIPDFEARKGELGIEEGPAAEADPNTGEILDLLGKISEWKPPVQRGNRTWDDREFFQSLDRQFRQKKSLSPRQVAAMRKMAGRYASAIPGFSDHADRLGLKAPSGKRRGASADD